MAFQLPLPVYKRSYLEVLGDTISYQLYEPLVFDRNINLSQIKEPKEPDCFTPVWALYRHPVGSQAAEGKEIIPAVFLWYESSRRVDSFPAVNADTNEEIEIAVFRVQVLLKDQFGPPGDQPTIARTVASQGAGFLHDINYVLSNNRIRSTYGDNTYDDTGAVRRYGNIGTIYGGIDDPETILMDFKKYAAHKIRISEGFWTRIEAIADPVYNVRLGVVLTVPYR